MIKKTMILILILISITIIVLSTKKEENDVVVIKFDTLLVFEKDEYLQAVDFDTIIKATLNEKNVQVSNLREVSFEGPITDVVTIELDSNERQIYNSFNTKLEKNQWIWEQFSDKIFKTSYILYTHKDGSIESFPYIYHIID